VLHTKGEGFSLPVDLRSMTVGLTLVGVIFVVAVVTLSTGSVRIPFVDVVRTLVGDADEQLTTIVVEWRLPRVLFAVVCGAALGMSGAVFQSLTRNPLGSPDVIGFDQGAYTGAMVVMLATGSLRYYDIAVGALVGGILTAAVVYALSYRHGVQGFRLIIMGIGVAGMLGSVSAYLVLYSDPQLALTASTWGAGSLDALGFAQFWPMFSIFAVLVPMVLLLGPPMRQLELGDDASTALGVRPERTRLTATVVGVALTALVTAAAGPITFIALAAPQIARRVTGASGLGLVPAGLMGALLLTVSDLVAMQLGVPVGIVTISVGGAYLVWLLIGEYRRR